IFSSGTGTRTGARRRASALVLIIAFHPANVEAVVWINGRSELWALLGGAGALVALTRGRAGSVAQAALVGCSLLVSLCGKETGLISSLLTLLLTCARRDASAAQIPVSWHLRKPAVAPLIAVGVAVAAYAALRANALGRTAVPGAGHLQDVAAA